MSRPTFTRACHPYWQCGSHPVQSLFLSPASDDSNGASARHAIPLRSMCFIPDHEPISQSGWIISKERWAEHCKLQPAFKRQRDAEAQTSLNDDDHSDYDCDADTFLEAAAKRSLVRELVVPNRLHVRRSVGPSRPHSSQIQVDPRCMRLLNPRPAVATGQLFNILRVPRFATYSRPLLLSLCSATTLPKPSTWLAISDLPRAIVRCFARSMSQACVIDPNFCSSPFIGGHVPECMIPVLGIGDVLFHLGLAIHDMHGRFERSVRVYVPIAYTSPPSADQSTLTSASRLQAMVFVPDSGDWSGDAFDTTVSGWLIGPDATEADASQPHLFLDARFPQLCHVGPSSRLRRITVMETICRGLACLNVTLRTSLSPLSRFFDGSRYDLRPFLRLEVTPIRCTCCRCAQCCQVTSKCNEQASAIGCSSGYCPRATRSRTSSGSPSDYCT